MSGDAKRAVTARPDAVPARRPTRTDLARARGYGEFMPEARAAALMDHAPWAGWMLLLLAAIMGAGWYWAANAVVDEVTLGQGRVIPSSREQVIQSLEGGIVSELTVKEGDVVDRDQVLLRLDDTRFGTSYRESAAKAIALRASNARLRAESDGGSPVFPPDVQARSDLVRNEMDLFQSRRRALEEGLAAFRRSLQYAEEELQMTEPMVAKGVVSEVEVLRLRRQVSELRASLLDRQNKFRAEARSELSRNETELAGLREVSAARADQFRRTVIRSPMRGTVKSIRLSTLGGVVQPGQDIMEIVPLEDQLLVEARVRPSDIAFIRPGQQATVKITAYDYSIYGGLQGSVENISADTLADEKRPDEAYYRVRVRTRAASLKDRDGKALPIIPGMTATVEVLTGQKTVLDYLLKPLIKAKDSALRER